MAITKQNGAEVEVEISNMYMAKVGTFNRDFL